MSRPRLRFRLRLWGLALASILVAGSILAHSMGTNGPRLLSWHTAEISRVVSASYTWNNLGVTVLGEPGRTVKVDDRSCLRGGQFDIDVSNDYAFDIDETVVLSMEVERAGSGDRLFIAYDKNGGLGLVPITLPKTQENRFRTVTVSLPRARFADRGDYRTDIMLVGHERPLEFPALAEQVTICDLRVRRDFATAPTEHYGWVDLTVVDETGKPAPVRVGLYDESGRMPIPSDGAVEIERFSDRTRTMLLRAPTVWPVDNKYVFYIEGRYRARVPAGRYRLVGTRGLEYRTVDRTLTVDADRTTTITIALVRWRNQPHAGWYSGDVHIHRARRDPGDGHAVLLQARAEDLHVANLLQMGDVAGTYFPQFGWGQPEGRLVEGTHAVVSGQEDPRTSIRGHSIHLNLSEPVRFPDQYLLYHRVFEAVEAQGGLSGYAHTGIRFPGTRQGLALDAPFDLVDFVEIAQHGTFGTALWFDLLNLGYRIAPAAGTDYPYLDHPGAVRNYVRLPDGYDVDDWFAALERGRTFVTNGPLLTLSANGAGMGEEIRLSAGERLLIDAEAAINPDIDGLDRIELIEQGRIVAVARLEEPAEALRLIYRATGRTSTWFVLRAHGRRAEQAGTIAAVSAPVYVVVDGRESTWKRHAVPRIVERMTAALNAPRLSGLAFDHEPEWWDTGPVWESTGDRQVALLAERIEAARAKLSELARRALEK